MPVCILYPVCNVRAWRAERLSVVNIADDIDDSHMSRFSHLVAQVECVVSRTLNVPIPSPSSSWYAPDEIFVFATRLSLTGGENDGALSLAPSW
jgi:hypothetical protein